MFIYLLWFFISVIIYLSTEKFERKIINTAIAILLFGLGIFVGLGDMLGGYDRYIYGSHFDSFADSISAWEWDEVVWKLYNETRSSEMGFSFTYIIVALFSENRYIYIFCVTLLIYTLLFISFKRYVKNYPIAFIIFMGLWFFFTFTYLRQVLACTIAWLAIKYIIKRDFIRFLLIALIAYTIHNSAIIIFPFYFIPIVKFNKTKIIFVMALLLIIGLTNLPASLFEVFGNLLESEHRTQDYAQSYAFRYEYIFEAVLFLYIILNNYNRIPQTKQNLIMLNMSLVFCGVLLFFCLNSQGGRLSWFFMLGLIVTLSTIANSKKLNALDNIILILLSLLLYIRILVEWDILIVPYKTTFTNGYRKGDYIHENYEYDSKYDENKLYRKAFRIPDTK